MSTPEAPLAALARKLRKVLSDEERQGFDSFYQSILPRLDHTLSQLSYDEVDKLSSWATLLRQRERTERNRT